MIKWSGTFFDYAGTICFDYALRHTPDDALASERAAQGVHDMSIMDHNLIMRYSNYKNQSKHVSPDHSK